MRETLLGCAKDSFRFLEEMVSGFAGRVQFWLHPRYRFLDGLADKLVFCLPLVIHARRSFIYEPAQPPPRRLHELDVVLVGKDRW